MSTKFFKKKLVIKCQNSFRGRRRVGRSLPQSVLIEYCSLLVISSPRSISTQREAHENGLIYTYIGEKV